MVESELLTFSALLLIGALESQFILLLLEKTHKFESIVLLEAGIYFGVSLGRFEHHFGLFHLESQ